MTTESVTVKRPLRFKLNPNDFILEVILVLIFVFLAFTAKGFLSADNMFNILRNASMAGIIAFGMTLVIIAGEIDLSVGSAIAFYGCLCAVMVRDLTALHYPVIPVVLFSMAVCLILGIVSGMFTGWLRDRFSVPTFITTLALMAALRGGAYLLTGSFPVRSFPEWYFFFGGGYVFGVIPFQAVVLLAVFGIMYFVSKYTTFGRAVYAVGGNAESARLSGINVRKTRMKVMALTGFLAAISGLIVSAQIQSGNPLVASGQELNVISACIIGGVSLMGGKGRIWGTFIGVVFLNVLLNGMTLLNIDEYWQYVAKAVLILVAVLIYQSQEGKQRN